MTVTQACCSSTSIIETSRFVCKHYVKRITTQPGGVKGERAVTASGQVLLVARRVPTRKKKKLKTRFVDFKQQEEPIREGINASQLAIKNFNYITGKHMNTPNVFYFYVIFLKNQDIPSSFLQKSKLFFLLFSL